MSNKFTDVLEALKALNESYIDAYHLFKPRSITYPNNEPYKKIFREDGMRALLLRQDIERHQKNLIKTGYPVPDSWLTVRTIGNISLLRSADDTNVFIIEYEHPECKELDQVLREIDLAILRWKLVPKFKQRTSSSRYKPPQCKYCKSVNTGVQSSPEHKRIIHCDDCGKNFHVPKSESK